MLLLYNHHYKVRCRKCGVTKQMTLCSTVTAFPGGVGSAFSCLSDLRCCIADWEPGLIRFLIPLKSEESGTGA